MDRAQLGDSTSDSSPNHHLWLKHHGTRELICRTEAIDQLGDLLLVSTVKVSVGFAIRGGPFALAECRIFGGIKTMEHKTIQYRGAFDGFRAFCEKEHQKFVEYAVAAVY